MKAPTLPLALLLLSPALAHDFWVQPARFRLAPDQLLLVDARVGDDLEGEVLPRDPALIERFFTRGPGDGPGETRPVRGLDGRAPMGYLRPKEPGLHWIALTTRAQRVEMPSLRFQVYLAEEGLTAILRERARLGESTAPGRERFSRCAKSAVLVGEGRGSGWSEELGLPLELVLDGDPADRGPGRARACRDIHHGLLGVRLLRDGEPLPGTLVTAVRRGATERVLSARTDREGRVRLALDTPGQWLISAVHMARDEGDEDSEWRSWWASLTFDLPTTEQDSPETIPRKGTQS